MPTAFFDKKHLQGKLHLDKYVCTVSQKSISPTRANNLRAFKKKEKKNNSEASRKGTVPFNKLQLLSNIILRTFQLYLTFHTYGQYILYPWGYARHDAVDKNDLHRLGQVGAAAARRATGHKYSVGSAAKMLYPAAGNYVQF